MLYIEGYLDDGSIGGCHHFSPFSEKPDDPSLFCWLYGGESDTHGRAWLRDLMRRTDRLLKPPSNIRPAIKVNGVVIPSGLVGDEKEVKMKIKDLIVQAGVTRTSGTWTWRDAWRGRTLLKAQAQAHGFRWAISWPYPRVVKWRVCWFVDIIRKPTRWQSLRPWLGFAIIFGFLGLCVLIKVLSTLL